MRRRSVLVAALLATGSLLSTSGIALATDQPIAGQKLKMKDATQPGVARRRVVFAARDASIVIPADGSSADPTLHGGAIEIANSAGTGEVAVVTLPTGGWRRAPRDTGKPLVGWKYREVVNAPPANDFKIKVVLATRSSGPVLRALVKDDRGNVIAYTLDEPTQGSMAIRIVTGTDRHCAEFGGYIRSDESRDLGDGVFRGVFIAKDAPAATLCTGAPAPPV